MSEIKLFSLKDNTASEIQSHTILLEKSLQIIIEKNLDTILGVQFLQSEYSTGKTHAGRIDTLGIDENGSPVIIEYKRAINENVINQGLYYLDWLLDHRGEFTLLVMEVAGKEKAEEIEWNGPRLICIAADYTKYDEHAVKQINRNIDLVRYRKFGSDLLALELVHRTSATDNGNISGERSARLTKKSVEKTLQQSLSEMDTDIQDIYEQLRSYLLALGDDVQEKETKLYLAYRKIKNFTCIQFQKKSLILYLKLNPDSVPLEEGFSRDVRFIGHWATGDLEITIRNSNDLNRALPLVQRSYDEG